MRVPLFVIGTALAVALALALAACGANKPTRDKAYFTAHARERAQVLADCRNDPGQHGATADCASAIQSDADAEHDRVFHGAARQPPGVANAGHL
jgi:hypothetical protein